MGAEIDLDRRFAAEEAYITGSVTFEQLSISTGISATQLRRWAADENWQERRQQHRREIAESRRNFVALKKKLLEEALRSMDPNKVYAYARIEKLSQAAEQMQSTAGAVAEPDRPRLFLEDMEFVVGVLKEIDPEGLKIIARSFDEIVARFKEKHAQAA